VGGSVAYHDACHLLHARGIAAAPRAVCEAALGRPPVDLGENAICCGSAGSYNLDHPAISEELGARKATLARERGATMVAVGNVGCLLQISRSLALAGLEVPVRHPVELLAEAYRRSDTTGSTTW
jgi:glycolate oxidase iron-sulfur subunit